CVQAQDAPDTALTPAQALACGMAITASSCDAFLNHPEPAACLAAPGPGAGGCSFSAQCSTTFCGLGQFPLCGPCRDIPQAGTSCATSGCGPTLVCSATQVCEPPGALNAQCDLALPCASGLTCVGATNTAKGTCQTEIATLGAACDSTHKTRAGC